MWVNPTTPIFSLSEACALPKDNATNSALKNLPTVLLIFIPLNVF
ncbi:hypothetical protein BFV93_3386 [Alteromonas macleodii]|nr:hypothetical protein BFV93_3386 [Alteromonas macleodii]